MAAFGLQQGTSTLVGTSTCSYDAFEKTTPAACNSCIAQETSAKNSAQEFDRYNACMGRRDHIVSDRAGLRTNTSCAAWSALQRHDRILGWGNPLLLRM